MVGSPGRRGLPAELEQGRSIRTLAVILAVVVIGGFTGRASAQCNFNEPGKAKGHKLSLVRSFSACPGVTFLTPNTSTSTGGGTPGCTPPFAHSRFEFSSKGSCSAKFKQEIQAPCAAQDAVNDECVNLAVQAKCNGIVDPNDGSLIDGPANNEGWVLWTVLRVTSRDRDRGDMTLTDLPFVFAFSKGKRGKLALKADWNDVWNFLFGSGAELPACTAFQLITVEVDDPDGDVFAVPGSSTR